MCFFLTLQIPCKNGFPGTGEMTPWLRAFAAFQKEDPSLVYIGQLTITCNAQLWGILWLSGLLGYLHMYAKYININTKKSLKIIFIVFYI